MIQTDKPNGRLLATKQFDGKLLQDCFSGTPVYTHTQAEVDGQNENKMSLPIILRAAGDTILVKA